MFRESLAAALRFLEAGDFENALPILLDLHEADPRHPGLNYWLGVVFLSLGHAARAIDHLNAAARMAKKDAAVFAALADALLTEDRAEEALPHARRAVALDGKSDRAHRTLGDVYARLRRPVMAEHAFKTALSLDGTSIGTHLAMAQLKSSLGDRNSSADHFRKAFDLAPRDPAVLIAAREQTDSALRDEALRNIEDLLAQQQKTLFRNDRGRLAFTAGRICDDTGDLDRAFHHFDSARPDLYGPYDAARQERFFDRFREVFTKAFFAERADFALASDRPVFVFGMPRSGTSLIEAILSRHPDVAAAGELTFFDTEVAAVGGAINQDPAFFDAAANLDRKTAQRIGRRYLAELDRIGRKERRVIDKMPHNFEHLWLIALLFPNARFCHAVRNPADTCLSIYTNPLESRHTYNRSQESLGHYYGQYRKLMRHWDETLQVAIRTQSYEDLVSDPDTMRRELVDHVGLDWNDACLNHERTEAQVFTLSMNQVRQPIYTSAVNRHRAYRDHIGPLLQTLERSASAQAD